MKKVDTQSFDALDEKLYSKLSRIYDTIRKEEKVEVFGNLGFEIVDKIDDKHERIAKLKGNKIIVQRDARNLPQHALKYIIAHEIAHMLTKKHTRKFWKILSRIYRNLRRRDWPCTQLLLHTFKRLEFRRMK